MQFQFTLNLDRGLVYSEDPNFFLATEFDKKSLSKLNPYNLFPDRGFYQSLSDNFLSDGNNTIHFYNYLFTSDGKRIRISGKAEKFRDGYNFQCKRERLKDATLTQMEKKNSLLHAVNRSAELFMRQLNWKRVIGSTLDIISKAGDISDINLWQTNQSKETLKLLLKNSTDKKSRQHITISPSDDFTILIDALKKRQSVATSKSILPSDASQIYKSVLLIPVHIENIWWGILEFSQLNRKKWDAEEIVTLESYSKLLASAIRSYSINKKLKETERKLNLITETTGSVLYCHRQNENRYDYISPSIKKFLSINNSIDKKNALDGVIGNGNKVGSYDGKPNNELFRITGEHGKKRYVCDQKFKWKDENGSSIGTIGILQDVTNRIEYEEELKRNNKILHAVNLFTNSVFNKKETSIDLNTLLKYLGEALDTDRVYLFIKHERQRFSLEAFWFDIHGSSSDNKNIFELEFENQDMSAMFANLENGRKYISNGENEFPYSKSSIILPIFNNGSLYGFLGFDEFEECRKWSKTEINALGIAARVIGASIELKDFIGDLVDAKKEAQKSDKLKSEFIAQISHEIRSPLNVILSFLGILWQETRATENKEITEIYDAINLASKRLIRTIDLLIEASEIQSGTYKADFTKFDCIDEILYPCFVTFRAKAEKKKLLFLRESGSIERTILGDNKSVSAILNNLIENAIKYTSEGYVKISDYNKESHLYIEVEDSGKGISPEYIAKMFTPFTQENEGYTREFEGMGLGMFIVKKYCELNEIELFVESNQGKGTKFILKIPLASLMENHYEGKSLL